MPLPLMTPEVVLPALGKVSTARAVLRRAPRGSETTSRQAWRRAANQIKNTISGTKAAATATKIPY